jgi:hypothetical protein
MGKRALTAEEARVLARTSSLRDALSSGLSPRVARVAAGDRVRISDDSAVVGTIENASYVLTTFFGMVELPASRVAGLAPAGGAAGAWVILRDGQALRGELADPVIRLKLREGSPLKIPVSEIRECGYRLPDKEPPKSAAVGSTILLRTGERLYWTECKQALQLKTAYGALDLPMKSLLSVEAAMGGGHAVRLVNGSVLSGTLEAKAVKFRLELGAEAAIEPDRLARVEWPAKAVESPGLAVLRMRNGDRLLGEIKEANLTVQTKFGPADFAADSVQELAFDANQPGAVVLQAWGGNAVRGTLAGAAVEFEIAPLGPRVKAPADQIVSITCPFALPAGVRKEVERLVALLGAGSFKDREAASQALVKFGKDIVPLLKKYLADNDPEVRNRVQTVVDQLAPDAPATPPAAP